MAWVQDGVEEAPDSTAKRTVDEGGDLFRLCRGRVAARVGLGQPLGSLRRLT